MALIKSQEKQIEKQESELKGSQDAIASLQQVKSELMMKLAQSEAEIQRAAAENAALKSAHAIEISMNESLIFNLALSHLPLQTA